MQGKRSTSRRSEDFLIHSDSLDAEGLFQFDGTDEDDFNIQSEPEESDDGLHVNGMCFKLH